MFQSLNLFDDEDGQFEKTCTKGLLTPEEIEDLKFDEDLSDLQKANRIIDEGQPSQKIGLTSLLPSMLLSNPATFDSLFLSKFANMVNSAPTELLTICGKCVSSLLKTRLISNHLVVQHFVPLMWAHLDSRETTVYQAWLTALEDYITLSSRDVLVQSNLVKQALAKGNLSQKTSSRVACTRLLAALCQRLDRTQIESDIYPVIRLLCQDIDYDVRSAMCNALVDITRHIGEVMAVKLLVPELSELLEDEETSVKDAALTSLVDMLPLLSKEVATTIIGPMLWPYLDVVICEKPSHSHVTVARILGKLGYNLQDSLTDSRKDWYVKYYIKLAKLGGPSSTENGGGLSDIGSPDITLEAIQSKDCDIADSISFLSAYNFPAICYNIGSSHVLNSRVLEVQASLASHSHRSVRKAVAAGMHEVAKMLGQNEAGILLPVLNGLLMDSSPCVMQALSRNITTILYNCTPSPPRNTLPIVGLPVMIPALLHLEHEISVTRDWRSHVSIVTEWSELTGILTSEQITANFTPRLLKILANNVICPVKEAVLLTLIKFIFTSKYLSARLDLVNQINKCLARSKKFQQRLLYVDFCFLVLDRFSRRFFKEHCFTPALLLISDPVPAVRVRSCRLLSHLKLQLRMPSDRPMLQQLEASSRRCLMSERNKAVMSHIQEAVIELDQTDVKLDSERDPEDKKREELQNQFIVKEVDIMKGRSSLPEIASLDLKDRRRKGSISHIDTDHKEPVMTGRQRRKMSQAVITARRNLPGSAPPSSRRASMPPTNQLADVVTKARASTVKLKAKK